MQIRYLQPDEKHRYVDFLQAAEASEIGRRVSNLERWRRWAESTTAPFGILLAVDEADQWLGAIQVQTLDPQSLQLGRLLRAPSQRAHPTLPTVLLREALKECHLAAGIDWVFARPVQAQLNPPFLEALAAVGLESHGGRIEFQSQVADLPAEGASRLTWHPVTDAAELLLAAETLRQASSGDPLATDFREAPLESLQASLAEDGLTHDLKDIHLGTFQGQPAAYIHVQTALDSGWARITYMGLLPPFRGIGLGREVHRHGFQLMKDGGGRIYQGGTSEQNTRMLKLFRTHGCQEYLHMDERKRKLAPLPGLRAWKASREQHPAIFAMGQDVWGAGLSGEQYQDACQSSEKYRRGCWWVWGDSISAPRASLLVHALGEGLYGIGSVATAPEHRRQGFASQLILEVCQHLEARGAIGIALHSDIAPAFYARLGFRALPEEYQRYAPDSTTMLRSRRFEDILEDGQFSPPAYF